MSNSFRLKYFFGLISSARKIDSAWNELLKMRNELHQIETSKELARFNELNQQIQSNEFQTNKCDVERLSFIGSTESQLLTEKAKLDHSKPIIDYFKFIQSPDFARLKNISESSQLARFFELKTIVESPDFIRRKNETQSLSYKGSPEFLKRQEYNALQKDARLKRYNNTIGSDEYRLFLNLESSEKANLNDPSKRKDPNVIKYNKYLNSKAYINLTIVQKLGLPVQLEQLKQETNAKPFLEREAFLKNKARYEITPDYPTFNEFAGLSKSCDIQFYLKCTKSPIYINYQKVVDSIELTRLIVLKSEVEVSAFVKRVAFLKNKKRYNSTPEYKLEIEFHELEKNKIITTYHQLKKRPELAFFDKWEIVMDENFTKQQLATNIWEPENYWGSKMAGYSFSQKGELQAYKGLKNIEFQNDVLSIVTKAEKSDGKVWDPAFGLIPHKFDFSSAMLNTGNGFRFNEGVVEAKVKFTPNKAITSAFSLTGNNPFPQIDVFRSGNNCVGVGVIDQPGIEGFKKSIQIKGLNFKHFHIFRLEVLGNQAVWKINNYEVHRGQIADNMNELFLNFIGTIHQPVNGEVLPHHFEIDWVRCLKKK